MSFIHKNIIFVLCCFSFLPACERQNHLRQYTEINVVPAFESSDPHAFMRNHPPVSSSMNTQDPVLQAMINNSAVKLPLSWDVPQGWEQVPSSSGLRLASFASLDKDNPIDCSIVTLGGMAGGVESNITRWAGQINLNLSADQLSAFINQAQKLTTKTGLAAVVYDFTFFQDKESSEQSMMAAIIESNDTTVFIKMTGEIKAVLKNKEMFNNLVVSVKEETE